MVNSAKLLLPLLIKEVSWFFCMFAKLCVIWGMEDQSISFGADVPKTGFIFPLFNFCEWTQNC